MAFLSNLLLFGGGYNSLVVMLGVSLLGAACGFLGVFIFLKRQVLLADSIAHSTFTGLGAAFLIGFWLTGNGRSIPLLMAGAIVAGAIAVFLTNWLRARRGFTEDAAIGNILALEFGIGVTLFSVIQLLPAGGQAGIHHMLTGAASGLLWGEAMVIGGIALFVAVLVVALFKELTVVAFDEDYAAVQGWPVGVINTVALGLLLLLVSVGIKLVGLILIVALMILPPVTARFWTDDLRKMTLLSAVIGAVSCYAGAAVSVAFHGWPSGPAIVLFAGALCLISVIAAPAHGVLWEWLGLRALRKATLSSSTDGEGGA